MLSGEGVDGICRLKVKGILVRRSKTFLGLFDVIKDEM